MEGNKTAIDSYFRTGNLAWCAIAPDKQWKGIERLVEVNRIEPDFVQSGDITIKINAREYARSEQTVIAEEVFNENSMRIDLRSQGREITMEIRSNVVSGFYELGNTLLDITIGDVRPGEGGD